MTAKTPRPLFVSFSIVFFWLQLILYLIAGFSIASIVFSRGWVITVFFVIEVAMTILILATIINVQNSRPSGRWLGIITLGIIIALSFSSIWDLFNWKYGVTKAFIFTAVMVGLRLVVSPVVLLAFVCSSSVKNYFKPDTEPLTSPLSLTFDEQSNCN